MNEAILEKVQARHEYVQAHVTPNIVVMTVLVGSQNYGLENENSDIDTYSFILPPFGTFIQDRKLETSELDFPDGSKATIKDFRSFMKLLRRPTPNSVECLLSEYKVYDKNFAAVLTRFLDDEYMLYSLTHADFNHMINSTLGTMACLHGRNMSEGKKVSHVIRLYYLLQHYCESCWATSEYLTPYGHQLTYAKAAKNQELSPELLNQLHNLYLEKIDNFKQNYTISSMQALQESISEYSLQKFEQEIILVYLAVQGVKIHTYGT